MLPIAPVELSILAALIGWSVSGADGADGLDHTYPSLGSERQPPSRRDVAFVVVAVAIVAAIVFLVIRLQTEQARAINCADNLRDIGAALMLYAQDYDETFPNRLTGWPPSATTWQQQEAFTWRASLKPYLRETGRFRCLSNPRNRTQTGCTATGPCGSTAYPDGYYVSYACNEIPAAPGGTLPRGFCGEKGEAAVAMRSIQSTSQLIAVVEDLSNWSEFDVVKPSFADELFVGHLTTSNYLFADGHVGRLRPRDTLAPTNLWLNSGGVFPAGEDKTACRVLGVSP